MFTDFCFNSSDVMCNIFEEPSVKIKSDCWWDSIHCVVWCNSILNHPFKKKVFQSRVSSSPIFIEDSWGPSMFYSLTIMLCLTLNTFSFLFYFAGKSWNLQVSSAKLSPMKKKTGAWFALQCKVCSQGKRWVSKSLFNLSLQCLFSIPIVCRLFYWLWLFWERLSQSTRHT